MNATFIDLSGFWLADFEQNGLELMEITLSGSSFVAHKITGDANVPANQISFTVDRATLVGKIQVAEKGFVRAQWMPGKVERILNNQSFVFTWTDTHRTFTVARRFTRIHIGTTASPAEDYLWDANDPIRYVKPTELSDRR